MIPSSLLPSFVLYCAVSAVTPGPANLCSLASAVKYGRRQALRQWRGIFIGFAVVALVSSVLVWSLGEVLSRYLQFITWIGAGYILWLAWNILHSDSSTEAKAGARCNFLTGLLVQLTNPKIMVFCMTALTTFALPYAASYRELLSVALILPFTGPMGNLIWLFAGTALQRFFRDRQRAVNMVMALLLAFCAVRIILS